MDLNVHRAILWLALDRVRSSPNVRQFPCPAAELADRVFFPLWLGNWLTDMNQASAFFDVMEQKYRDPYQRWRTDGTYEFPQGIAAHQDRWVAMFNSLWETERNAVATLPTFKGIRCPDGLRIADANVVGGYYPCDHFDVADRLAPACSQCNEIMGMSEDQSAWVCTKNHERLPVGSEGARPWSPVPDSVEYDREVRKLSHTVHRGVFVEVLWGPLKVALQGDRTRFDNLRRFGKALHVLQDFYAHSNFAELLVQCTSGLPQSLTEVLKAEATGSFASFIQGVSPAEMTVVSGRFDQVDTVAAILKIYRQNLIPRWEDLAAGGYRGEKGKARDLMVEVLFGTFSNQPFARDVLGAVKTAFAVTDFLSSTGDLVTRGAIRFFAGVAGLLADPEARDGIKKLEGLLLAANEVEARDYAKAGRIMYVERAIERHLQEALAQARRASGPRVLPHHTLLAKDQDVSQPECRLVFKLACLLATDLTAELLDLYLSGADFKAFESLLTRRIAHPRSLLGDEPRTEAALQRLIPRIYGERWWQVGQAPANVVFQ